MSTTQLILNIFIFILHAVGSFWYFFLGDVEVKIARIFSIVLSLLLIINHSLVIGGCCSRPRVYTHRPDAGAHELGVELQNVRGEQQNGPINGLDGEIENSGEYRAPLLPWWIRVQNLFNHTVDNRGGRKEVIDDALLDYQ